VLNTDSTLLRLTRTMSNDRDFTLERYEQHLLVSPEGLKLSKSLHKVADCLINCINGALWQVSSV